ncbi:hypothetical protein BBBOND_0110200 [Babesia bigemina]|uniref:Uncharacterized protein n=1 Tax=Babesia bigemina TaxID=5866 RepID=A0A061D3T3_BABBI|nr:hypothetical protein BBBOND_0110200 [Babesia bigemina]CDR94722.1 hypothetical protein BBBOND_0110200 [Babesia bigemina]|eukprot:XP_012766908.1 hypothetical protein BBBOND_0110200 [Babesia bigemina]
MLMKLKKPMQLKKVDERLALDSKYKYAIERLRKQNLQRQADAKALEKRFEEATRKTDERRIQEEAERREEQKEEERKMRLHEQAYYDYANSFDGKPAPDPTDFILMNHEAINRRRVYKEEEERERKKDLALKKVLDAAARDINIPIQMPRNTFVRPIGELDGHAPAIVNHVDGSSLTSDSKGGANVPTSQHVTPPRPPMPDFKGTVISDSNLHSSPIPTEYLEPPPPGGMEIADAYIPPKIPEQFEIDIHVPKLKLPDNDLNFDLTFDDDSTHIKTDTLPDPVDPPFPAVSFNIAPPDVEQSMPPPQDFDPEIIHRPELKMCISSWATSTPTPGSTDIPETERFPAEAPSTVRDMLQWLAGLKHEKHHDTLKQCINKAFGGPHSDPLQRALHINHTNIRPNDVFDILQLTATFASSVLNSIAPNWRAHVSSKPVQPKPSDQSDEPDCCALICQLRDYVYACHYQLEFLKAQCGRDKQSGGWKSCEYGSDSKTSSPLQAFLTDGWDSTFKTHLFDPCNLCHKSRVRMGFKKEDLHKDSKAGTVLSSILSPSCGGEDHDALVDTKW